jgi:hypothetical protein
MTGPLVVFDLLIPRTDDRTGIVHSPLLFDAWALETAERFGGVTQIGADILGFWFDRGDLVEDHSHWYRVAVREDHVEPLRAHVRETARRFGQRCLYFQRSGEAELIWAEGSE